MDDNVRKYLPELPNYGKTITIENLLYHTSGIRDYMVLMWLTGKSFEEPFNNADAIEIITRQGKLNFNPGDECRYSNSNYVLLAEIIYRITGQSLAEYVSEHLLKKLGMNASGFGGYNIKEGATRSVSYGKRGDNYVAFKAGHSAHGDGGMLVTLEDLVRWDKEFYDESSLVQEILKKGKLNNGTVLDYGMGIISDTYRNENIHTHSGAFLGYRTETLRFPSKKISIICLGNAEDINPELITRAIADVYVFGDRNTPAMRQGENTGDKAIIRLSAENLLAFMGTYEVTPNVFVQIRYEDGVLTGQVIGQSPQTLYPENASTLNIGSTGDKVVFEDLVQSKYQRLAISQAQGTTTAQRLTTVQGEDYRRYAGTYYCEEQHTSYQFYEKDGSLWFKVGDNPEVSAEVLERYNRCYFSYRNLELATIDFTIDDLSDVTGFTLNSERVSNILFVKK